MNEQGHNFDDAVPVDMLEDRLFDNFRAQVDSMIAWARTDAALSMQNAPLEEQALAQGFEATRLLTEAHMMVRAAREQRRTDVIDADARARVTTATAQEHTRTMLFGPVRTSRIAYRRHHDENLYPQDADLN